MNIMITYELFFTFAVDLESAPAGGFQANVQLPLKLRHFQPLKL